MPEKSYEYPFGQPIRYETANPLSEEVLKGFLGNRFAGISLEVIVAKVGAGYLFHIKKVNADAYQLYSYKKEAFPILLNLSTLTHFINHSSGLCFDSESWLLSNEINRRIDMDGGDDENQDEDEEESGI